MLTTTQEVQDWLIDEVVKLSGLARDEIRSDQTFSGFGIDSIGLTGIVKRLSKELGRELSPSLPFAYPTPRELTHAVMMGPRSEAAPTSASQPSKVAATAGPRRSASRKPPRRSTGCCRRQRRASP